MNYDVPPSTNLPVESNNIELGILTFGLRSFVPSLRSSLS